MDTTTELLTLICRQPKLGFNDFINDKDKVAEMTERLFKIVHGNFKWRWPDSESHLSKCQSPDDSDARQRDPKEDDDQYRKRLQLVETLRQRETQVQADWIRYATIVTKTLVFLSDQSALGTTMRGFHEGSRNYFEQRTLYHYMWMCFCQGNGPGLWQEWPQKPPESLAGRELTCWYKREVEGVLERVRTEWENGIDLDTLFPGWIKNLV
jgi:hypothetical protein